MQYAGDDFAFNGGNPKAILNASHRFFVGGRAGGRKSSKTVVNRTGHNRKRSK